MQNTKAWWEVPEVDLNLRHYSGGPSDTIKQIKYDIEKFLVNPDVDDKTRQIYSAIYNALTYYKNISYIPSPEFSTDETFLSSAVTTFNDDYTYLAGKYNMPNQPPVINVNGRIKSSIGVVEKIKEKITEYLDEGRDLRYFNESLRDLIGFRIIVDPPQYIKDLGEEAECNYLYQVYYDLMQHHGIDDQRTDDQPIEPGKFKFVPVNTRYSKTKLEKMKERPTKSGFSDNISTGVTHIHIPKSRPQTVEQPHVDSVTKDYVKWPKFSGYQSLHTCVVPDYSDYIETLEPPHYIIPSLSHDYTIEYQFRTKRQDDFAEHGTASHKFAYKPTETIYHRLTVPTFISFDDPEVLTEDLYASKNIFKRMNGPRKNKIRVRNFGESYKKFYGHSFKDRFNIGFKEFRDRFGYQDRDAVLAGKKKVLYNEERDWYYLEDVTPIVFVSAEDRSKFQGITGIKDPQKVIELFDETGLTDGMRLPLPEDSEHEAPEAAQTEVDPRAYAEGVYKLPNGVKLYGVISDPQDRDKVQDKQKDQESGPVLKKTARPSNPDDATHDGH